MTTAYSPLLGLALPVTGELAGTWGDTVNNYITSYLDSAVAGTQTISGSQTAVTLSKTTNAALSQAGTGSTGSSQYSVINCTGNPAGLLTITVPAASKTYVVVNATSTNQQVKVVGTGPTTGVTLDAGERAIIAWNGSDFIKVASSTVDGVSTISFGSTGLTPSTATSGAVTVAGTLAAGSGGTGQSTYTSGDLLYATGATALSKLGIGTNGQILTSTGTAPQWSTLSGVAVTTFSAGTTGLTPNTPTAGAVTLGGTLATTNGGTGLTSFTSNGVVYASSSSALTTGSALTFDGTNLKIGASAPTAGFLLDAQGASRFGANTGAVELSYNAGAFTASVVSYDRVNSAYRLLALDGSEQVFRLSNSEQMRLTSTGLGIGTSSPAYRLQVSGGATSLAANQYLRFGTAPFAAGDGSVTNYLFSGSTSLTWRNAADSADLMYLSNSGNLGLGVTPSAWGVYKALQINSAGFASVSGNNMSLSSNAFYNGSSWIYNTTDNATYYQQISGIHRWYTAPSGTAGNAISFSQVMTLDASGNLGIGTSSPTQKLEILTALASSTPAAIFRAPSGVGNTGGLAFYHNDSNTSARNWYLVANSDSYGDFIIKVGTSQGANPTSGTNVATFSSSGNLGLGVTPSAWSVLKALEIGAFKGAVYADNGSAASGLTNGAYYNSGWKYGVTSGSPQMRYEINGAGHSWFTAPSGTAGNAISFTQAMTLTQGGQLLAGATVENLSRWGRALFNYPCGTSNSVIGLQNSTARAANNLYGIVFADNTDESNAAVYVRQTGTNNGADLLFGTNAGTGGAGLGAVTERARITSGGYFCVGSTTDTRNIYAGGDNSLPILTVRATAASGVLNGINANFSGQAPNNTTSFFLQCNDTGAERATIRSNGGIANYQANDVNLSDRREKTNFAPAKDYLDTICAIPVQTFNYIDQSEDDPGLTLGVVAQDVQAVAPELVMESNWGTKDDPKMRLSIYQTDLQYALMKCIQELKAQNDDLRARVAQLEAK